jgi:hypothetical protein
MCVLRYPVVAGGSGSCGSPSGGPAGRLRRLAACLVCERGGGGWRSVTSGVCRTLGGPADGTRMCVLAWNSCAPASGCGEGGSSVMSCVLDTLRPPGVTGRVGLFMSYRTTPPDPAVRSPRPEAWARSASMSMTTRPGGDPVIDTSHTHPAPRRAPRADHPRRLSGCGTCS